MSGANGRPVFAFFSDPTRRRILDMLRGTPRTTGQISAQFPQSRFAVVEHLDVLEQCGLVSVRRKGRERWNSINATPLRRIYERWLYAVSATLGQQPVPLGRSSKERGVAMPKAPITLSAT